MPDKLEELELTESLIDYFEPMQVRNNAPTHRGNRDMKQFRERRAATERRKVAGESCGKS
jgi:hypothetical protein